MENIKKEKLRCTLCNKVIGSPSKYHPGDHLTCLKIRERIIKMNLMTYDQLTNRLNEIYNR